MRKNTKRKISTLLAGLALFMMGVGVAILQPSLNTVKVSAATVSDFLVEEKASIRTSTPIGIRFTVNMGDEVQDIYDDLKNVECGSILLPADMLNGELTLDTTNVLKIPTVNWKEEGVSYQSVLGGKAEDGGVVADLPESYYNRPIAARGYIRGEKDGKIYTYYTENTATRSIGYVATMAFMAGRTDELTTTIANKTNVRLVAEDITLSLSSAEGALLRNSYAAAVDAADVAYLEIGGVQSPIEVSYEITDGANVAEIVDGKIVAKAQGSATITANCTFNDVEYETAVGTVTVCNEFVGATDYAILLPATPTANENKAAETVQKAFKATGADIAIVQENGNEYISGKYISIGETALAKANVAITVAGNTSAQVATVGNTMFVRGASDVGTLNGAQQWLGEALGYDYYLRNTYSIEKKAVGLPAAKAYVPAIEYNMIDRNEDVMADYGLQKYSDGVIQVGGNIHNSTLVITPDAYYSAHSNWFATKNKYSWSSTQVLITDGTGKAAELCYTAHGNGGEYNSLVSTTASKLVAALKANPTMNRVGFSVRDGNYECACSSCKAKGNTSDTLVAFLNDVAAQMENGLAGDARQNTFKIVTLAYHQTNEAPKKITSLASYASFKNHIELWFGDSYGDYTDGLKDSSKSKNKEIYTNFQNWMNLVGDANVLLWLYYTNTKNGFVPYNTFTAIRENYAMAYDAGVDAVFNQTIQGRTGWTMLKHYLISKLAWNAKPTDAEWNAWIDEYFVNAYGGGATAMRKWFNDWLDDSLSAYATSDSNPAIHKNMATKANFPKATLEKWIGYAEAALVNLDESDPNYTTYKNNILLEKLSPEYFLIELYGMTADYAEEFVWGVGYWGITHLGESITIDATLNKIGGSIDSATITDKFYGEKQADGTYKVTLENGNIKAGESYSIKGANESGVSAEEDGKLVVTLPASAVGVNNITLTSKSYSIVFTNVIGVTKVLKTADDLKILNGAAAGSGNYVTGYYILGNDIDCADSLYEAGSYSTGYFKGTFDGDGYTISNIKVGSCGIFGALYGATIKDVSFTGVTIASTSNNFNTLFAGSVTNNSIIENVNVSYKAIEWPYANSYSENKMTGLLGVRWESAGATVVRNVTLDATGLTITNAIGYTYSNVTFENVTIFADDYTLIGCTEAYKNSTGVSEWPTGVTYVQTEKITISDQFIAEAGVVTLESDEFKEGEVYTVRSGNLAVSVVVEEDGVLIAELVGLPTGTISVSCSIAGKAMTFNNVLSVTKVIRTVEDLRAMDATTTSGHLRGYYVLGGNLDCEGATFSAGAADANKTLIGTFDGQGYTISNLKVGSNGIFSVIQGTVKDVNFTGVSIVGGDYNALLAGRAWGNAKIENVNVTYEAIQWPNDAFAAHYITGLLVARWSDATTVVVKDVVLDATGLDITNALGVQFKGTFTNVTVKGDSYALIGCTAANSSSGLTEWPAGVTFVDTLAEVEITDEMSALDGAMTLVSDAFEVGEVYTVKSGLISVTATVAEAGKLSVTLEGVGVGTISVVCKKAGKEIIFSNVKSELSVQIEEITVNTKCYADGGVVTLENEKFVVGESYTVTCGAFAAVATVSEAGKLSAAFADLAVGETLTVTCTSTTKAFTFTNVFSATKVLRTAEDLKGLDAYAAGTHLKGYYVLGGDINCNGMLFESAGRDSNKTFQGTFDGDGHTISNIRVGTNGIFSVLNGGTVKNVNFTGASLVQATNAGNHMTALFAGQAWGNVVIENVSVDYDALEWPCYNDPDSKYYWAMTGMLVARWAAGGSYVWKDVTLDATGLELTNVLGCDGVSGIACQNVKVLGDSYVFIGSTTANLNTPVSDWPTGVTYVDTLLEIAVADEITAVDGAMTLVCDAFEVGEVYTVKAGLVSVSATVAEAGKLSVTLDGVSVGSIGVLCTKAGKEITFSNVKFEASVQIEEITVNTKCYADGGVVTLVSEKFVVGESYTVTCGASVVMATVAEAGKLSATLSGLAVGQTYTVTCASTAKLITFTNVFSATKVIKTVDDLKSLDPSVGGAHLTGYYVLSGDINCQGATFSSGLNGSATFQGTFDGQGHTISNLKVGSRGFFSILNGGTVKDVNFTGVSLIKDGNGETALLAGRVWNATKIENVNVQFASIEWVFGTFNEYGNTGLLVARWSESAKTGWMKDVTIDATGLDITCALGCELGTIYNTIFKNVTVKGDSYEIIGSTASNCQSASLISEWPTGVTYICTKVVDGLEVTAPAESAYYTFNGQSSVAAGGSYTFTVAEKVSGLNDFIVLVNGQEMTGVNGTYTVENVTEALTIQILHGYIEYGSGASVSYDGDAATVTNSTSTSNEAYMAYISAEYVNYLLSQGYNYWDFYIIPDGEIANQTVISCGNTISRSTENAETAIARLQLKADTAIKFWCQKNDSGSAIQGAGGSMTVEYGSLRETA